MHTPSHTPPQTSETNTEQPKRHPKLLLNVLAAAHAELTGDTRPTFTTAQEIAITQTEEANQISGSGSAAEQFRHHLDNYQSKAMLLGWIQAEMIEDLAALARICSPDNTTTTAAPSELAPEDVAIEISVSPITAARDMSHARTITNRLPHALHELRKGRIDLPRLHTLARATRPLDDDLVAAVEKHVLHGGPRRTREAFTDATRRAVHTLDPDGSTARTQARKAERRVRILTSEDNASRLTAFLPADEAHACYQRIDQLARRISTQNTTADNRTTDQIRADVLVDLLTGRTQHAQPLSCDIQVIVPITTLLGTSTAPGEIPGIGSIPAAIAHDMAHRPGSTWRRILTDPRGHLLEVANRRHPTPAQTRHIRTRDRTCRHPGCTRQAIHCDIDHTIPHTDHGPTVTRNLGLLCRRHHRMRHQGKWKIHQPEPGIFHWTTALGHTVTINPDPYHHPNPSPNTNRPDDRDNPPS
ncbi:hypothetical protein FMEAI12_2740014 [Parafrankia sp. Ea1.12]|uniref:HNH endonuclease signature motif containing protein n=1 Tax=Parafrankia sp. Ea1.12 TaxID=573499 RepID=UPI000DA550AE|nr:HNH endonuclease signature motif containing protein [Parafrankia sp. Ea1.12]SQD94736.1 hypothetical protein FMEAI12_2740014 [Parafrankia sp. Ea1.12]